MREEKCLQKRVSEHREVGEGVKIQLDKAMADLTSCWEAEPDGLRKYLRNKISVILCGYLT